MGDSKTCPGEYRIFGENALCRDFSWILELKTKGEAKVSKDTASTTSANPWNTQLLMTKNESDCDKGPAALQEQKSTSMGSIWLDSENSSLYNGQLSKFEIGEISSRNESSCSSSSSVVSTNGLLRVAGKSSRTARNSCGMDDHDHIQDTDDETEVKSTHNGNGASATAANSWGIMPEGFELLLLPTRLYYKVNEDALFYLKVVGSYDAQITLCGVMAIAVHGSGHVTICDVISDSSGVSIVFRPMRAGRYSVKVYQNSAGLLTANINGIRNNGFGINGRVGSGFKCQTRIPPPGFNTLTAPLEIWVSRNYSFDAVYMFPNICNCLPKSDNKYWGVASDGVDYKVYLTNRSTNDVLVVDVNVGRIVQKFSECSGLKNEQGKLFRPSGLVLDHWNKRLIVADKDNHRVAFFSFDGQYISSFGEMGHNVGQFSYPWDVDISPNGDKIVVTDSRNHRIQIFDQFGSYLGKYSVFETAPFEYKKYLDYPRGVTFDKTGSSIYVTDFNSNHVLVVDAEKFTKKAIFGHDVAIRPQGITVDHGNNVLVCDSRNHAVRILSSNGKLLDSIHVFANDKLNCPVDVSVLNNGSIAVMEISGKLVIS